MDGIIIGSIILSAVIYLIYFFMFPETAHADVRKKKRKNRRNPAGSAMKTQKTPTTLCDEKNHAPACFKKIFCTSLLKVLDACRKQNMR